MPLWIASIGGWLVATVIGRVAATAGLAFVVVKGFTELVNWIKAQSLIQLDGLPAEVVAYAGIMKVDVALSIFFSAMVMKATIMATKKVVDKV